MAVAGKTVPKAFSSSSTMGSDEDHKVYCQPCDRNGPRLPAHGYCVDCREHLCDTCFTAHKRHTLSRHHTLLDDNSMPQTMSSASVFPSQPNSLTKPCPKHVKEMIKFYCQNHNAVLCSICVTLEHTGKYCKVNYIPDISYQVINSKKHQDILKTMDTIIEQCRKKSEDVKKMTANSNSSLTDVLSDIKKFRTEINQRKDELGKQAEDAAKAIQQENNKNLKIVETTCDDVTKSLKTSSDAIKYLNTTKQADKLFMELKFAEQMIKDYQKCPRQPSAYYYKKYNFMQYMATSIQLDKARPPSTFKEKSLIHFLPQAAFDIKEYMFKPNTALSNLLSLGSCTAIYIKCRFNLYQDKICVKTLTDEYTCFITGMIVLTPGLLIITDWNNNVVKMVDTCSKSVTDQLQLDAGPWDVTSVTRTELAVTLPYKRNIQFISVSSNKLKMKQTLKVDGKCYSISCCQGKLVVSFDNPAKLQILDISGSILTTVRGGNIFSKPVHVTTNTYSIYVSDSLMRTITRLNWKGEVTGCYGGKTRPYGITLSGDGTVFVCDYGRNVIEEVAFYCSEGKVVLKNLNDPFAVCWCAETSELYFSCRTVLYEHDNFLRVFKLS